MTFERARDLVGYGRDIPAVRWPEDAAIAVNLVVNYEEGSERSAAQDDVSETDVAEVPAGMGPEYRDLAMESMYEFGSRVGFWRLMRLFDEYSLPATIFACAVALENNPQVPAYIRTSRHDVCSHGWRWEKHWELSREEEREHIKLALASFVETLGSRPLGWYCRYSPSIHTRELIVEEGGFEYDSDSYNDELPYYENVNGKEHLVVPYTLTYNDVQGTRDPRLLLDYLRRGFDELRREGLEGRPKMMSIGLHPRLAGQAGRASALREFLEHALDQGDVWFANRIDIARWWADQYRSFK
jgi:peptidoglycan/xylan/chitin deacetylase (PgdA/CDA1 family)